MKRPFAHIGFSAAICLIAVNMVDYVYVQYIAAGLVLLFAGSLAVRKYRQALAVPLCIGAALIACLLFLCVCYAEVFPALKLDGTEAEIRFHVISLGEIKSGSYVYVARADSIPVSGAPQGIKLKIVSSVPITEAPYRVLSARASFRSLGNSAYTSYGAWGDSVYLSAKINAYLPTDTILSVPMQYVLSLREDIIDTLMNRLPLDSGALPAALVTGDRYYLSEEITSAFRLSGVSHLTAVSGFHLGVICGSLYTLLHSFGLNKRVCSALLIPIGLLYTALAGFSPSVIRAFVMLFTLLLGELIRRRADSVNSLGLAVFLLCLNPFAVCDVGALLSVTAVLSLLVIYPYLKQQMKKTERWLSKPGDGPVSLLKPAVSYVLKGYLVSVSVTLGTLPVMFCCFDSFSVAGIPANLLLIPLGSAETVLSFVCYLLCKMGLFSGFAIFLTAKGSRLIILLVKALSALGNLSFPLPAEFAYFLSAALFLVGIGFMLNGKRALRFSFTLSSLILVVSLAFAVLQPYHRTDVLLTSTGAVAAVNRWNTVVYNVSSSNDFYCVKSFIETRGGHITLLIDNKNSRYVKQLYDLFGAEREVKPVEDKRYDGETVANDYIATLGESFQVHYFHGGDGDSLLLQAGEASVFCGQSVSDSSSVSFVNGKAYDKYGTIDLSDGEVVYILNEKYITAGRL